MHAYYRAFGWPLGTLFLALTAAWIAGMIVLPQLSMIERAFVWEERGDRLTAARTEINRTTQEIALVELDRRGLERRRDALVSGAGTPAAPAGGPGAGVLAPTISGPSSPSPSPLPSPSVGGPAMPSVGGPAMPSVGGPAAPAVGGPGLPAPTITGPNRTAASAAATADEIETALADLDARRGAAQDRLAELRAEEARLAEEAAAGPRYSLQNFATMSEIHFQIFVSTILYAALVTVLAFVICYPVAYAVATTRSANRVALLLLALVVPYTINELLRIFAWVMILEREGVLNSVLTFLGVFAEGEGPRWVASNWAVFTVMVYAYILFMVFPLYNTLETLDPNQIDAARDLGASTWMLHRRVVIPHAKPGIAVGAIMVFMLSAGTIAAPEIVGRGLHPDWFSQVIYRRFFEGSNWNQGAAYSLLLLLACIAFIALVMSLFRVSIREVAR